MYLSVKKNQLQKNIPQYLPGFVILTNYKCISIKKTQRRGRQSKLLLVYCWLFSHFHWSNYGNYVFLWAVLDC